MDGLRGKIKASTLMETLVATSIIIIVFAVASLVLNNTFRNMVYNDTFGVQNRMEELHYLYDNNQIELPYYEQYQQFEITIDRELQGTVSHIEVQAKNSVNSKTLLIDYIDELQ